MIPGKLKKLLKAKRIIAFALSAAMLVTSVPETALAAEAVRTEAESAETESVETESTAGDTTVPQDTEQTDGSAAEGTESVGKEAEGTETAGTETEGTESAGTEAEGTESAGTEAEGTESAGTETEGTETAGTETEGTESAGTETEGTETDGSAAEGTESAGTEAEGTESAGTETEGTETAGTEIEKTEEPEVAAEGEAPALATKIVVDDTRANAFSNEDKIEGFTRKLDAEGLSFFTTYVNKADVNNTDESKTDKYADFQNKLKDWITIEVDGEELNALKDKLTYTWVKKAGDGGADELLKDALPMNVGVYELTISLDAIDGLCTKPEDVKLVLNIEQADIELRLNIDNDGSLPGETVGNFLDEINKNYTIGYDKKSTYEVSRDILALAGADKRLPLHVYELAPGGTRQEVTDMTARFSGTKDYVLTIDEVPLTAEAAKNYKLAIEDSYPITVGLRRETKVLFERIDAGEDLVKIYQAGASYSIESITADLFTATGAPKVVYIVDPDEKNDDGGYDSDNYVFLEGVTPEAKWYTRDRVAVDYDLDDLDEDAGEFVYLDSKDKPIPAEDRKGGFFVYKPMAEDPVDAGEYFIVYSYAGEEGIYRASHSEPVRLTIDPAPAAMKIDEIADGIFKDGMDEDAVADALAKVTYHFYNVEKNETGAEQIGTSEIADALKPGFFGTSYSGDVTDDVQAAKTQYFMPELVLQRRVSRITEKGGTAEAADPRAVDWKETSDLYVVYDEDMISEIAGELPNDADEENLESVEFEYRVFFTGQKVVYNNAGGKINAVSITDVTTNAANRNYLVNVTKDMLENAAAMVTPAVLKKAQVDMTAIVSQFKDDNRDSLYPQTDDTEIHKGTFENPATKIFDSEALFATRASYKKATVNELNENGEPAGTVSRIAPTSDALTYTWSYVDLETYEKYFETWDVVQREYRDFEDYYLQNDLGWTDMADGSFTAFQNAGIYRLTAAFEDPEHEYGYAQGEAFFKVERQEVIIVPTGILYARDGASVNEWINALNNTSEENDKRENKKSYTIYKLPHNSMEEYNALSDEAKKAYELPSDEAIVGYESENGQKPDMDLDVEWVVLRREKDPATGVDKEPAEWIPVDAGEKAGETFDADFTYGAAIHWEGNIEWLDEGLCSPDQKNYTTRNIAVLRETGEETHHESVGAVSFYNQELFVEVDDAKIQALGKEYDGTSVDIASLEDAFTIYTDKALTQQLAPTASMRVADVVNLAVDENGMYQYDPAKINVFWVKDGQRYKNNHAVYGGTYYLALYFGGGALGTVQEDGSVPAVTYAPLDTDGRADGWLEFADRDEDGLYKYAFTIRPREITIKPKPVGADSELLNAGSIADGILADELEEISNLVEKDEVYFQYTEITAGGFDVAWDGVNEDGTDKERVVHKYNIDKRGGYPAFAGNIPSYIIQVDGKEIKNPEEEYLRFGSTYTVKLTNELASPLKESYKVTYETTGVTITKRGSLPVKDAAGNGLQIGIIDSISDTKHSIRTLGAVSFFYEDEKNPFEAYGRDGEKVTLQNTNLLGLRICAPKEFYNEDEWESNRKKFVYKNAVWNAGGYFIDDPNRADMWFPLYKKNELGEAVLQYYYIDVVFPLSKTDKERTFEITWEDGYTETFTLDPSIVLEDDLTNAVAPKSIAFNGVNKKMAVGEKQQLDLKITKAQLGDVISIRYRIKGGGTKNDYISLDPETGEVTALKASGTATQIEAYPVCRDAKGELVPVTDSKGKAAKTASTKITVTAVTASKIKKITAQDNLLKLYYTVPNDGYRREIYVVDVTKGTEYASRKKWKPADFNKAIADIKNGQWKAAGFAIAPVYSYAKNEDLDEKALHGEYDKKLKAHIRTIYGLEGQHEYILYVRNVSAARALSDGSVVELSAAGSVKKFKAIKPQVKSLVLGFTLKKDETDKKNTVTLENVLDEHGKVVDRRYTVELSAKKAQLNVYGVFSDKEGGNDAAEADDRRKYSLVPMLKEEKTALKAYQMPKLAYAVYDYNVGGMDEEAFAPGMQQSKYATISNKGKITLKGVGLNGEKTIYIYVRDNNQHQDDYGHDAVIMLTITAKASFVTGKAAKLKVGQTIRLSDYLEYRDASKKKLPSYRSGGVTITAQELARAKAAGYEITEQYRREDWLDRADSELIHDWTITATAPNKEKFELNIKDYDAEGNPMSAKVILTSSQIDPVKGLKVVYVDDQHMTINFTHPSNLDEEDTGSVYQYLLEVKDARGSVVDTQILSDPNQVFDVDRVNAKDLKAVQTWMQYAGTHVHPDEKWIHVDNTQGFAFNYYTGTKAKKKTFAYTYTNDKLVRQSAYTLTVTPIYGDQRAAKSAKTKTKTTNIPASYENVDVVFAQTDNGKLGGNTIAITSSGAQQWKKDSPHDAIPNAIDINEAPYKFISGNVYTLRFATENQAAVDRIYDTLTWKSSNKKVASVKANKGTYTATLGAVNKGRTVITVTSKVTKRVVARWAIEVYAVKDGSSYGGGYEPTWGGGFYEKILALYDPYYDGRLEVLSENVPLTIDSDANVTTWVSFTAPYYGEYTFTGTEKWDFYDGKNGKKISDNGGTLFLEANQSVYFRVRGNATLGVTGTEFARLTKSHTKEAPLEIKVNGTKDGIKTYVAFTAWEDNHYAIYFNGKILELESKTYNLAAGETRYIPVTESGRMYVECREITDYTTIGTPASVTLDKDNQERYIRFTAPADGRYVFTEIKDDGVETTYTWANGEAIEDNDIAGSENGKTKEISLKTGDKVIIGFKAEPEITDAAKTLKASVTVTDPERSKLESTLSIKKGTTETVKFVIPSFDTDRARFLFKVSKVTRNADDDQDTDIVSYAALDAKKKDAVDKIAISDELTVDRTSDDKTKLQPGDVIYITVTAGDGKTDTDPEGKDAADAVLSVTQVPVTALTDIHTLDITNDTQQWYTFTAPKDGWYQFGVEVVERAGGDETPVHVGTNIAIYRKLFDSETNALTNERTRYLRTGEKLAIKLNPGHADDIPKDDGITEIVKSTVTVSVKAIEITPLTLNTETPVELPAKSKDGKYYSFTATVEANYTFQWIPADKNRNNANVQIGKAVTKVSGEENGMGLSTKDTLKVGDVRYIKVSIADRSSENTVNGRLVVTADNINAEALKLGTPYNYDIKVEDGEPSATKVVKFTAPETGTYEIITTAGKNDITGLDYAFPEITASKEWLTERGKNYHTIDLKKGETVYFTLQYTASGEEAETKGTIIINSLTKPFTADTDVPAEYGITAWYEFTIPASGRYEFKADYDEKKADVFNWKGLSGNYYLKNEKVTAYIRGKDEEAAAVVKLYAPTLITPVSLKEGVNDIRFEAGKTAYYELPGVGKAMSYRFDISDIEAGKAGMTMKYAVVEDNYKSGETDKYNKFDNLGDGAAKSLVKNAGLFIKMKGSETKDTACKLTVTPDQELVLGDNQVRIEAGASVALRYNAKEAGYYAFRVEKLGAELVLNPKKDDAEVGDKFYRIGHCTKQGSLTHSLRNEGSAAVDLTVKMERVEPVEVVPDKGATAEITLAADEVAYFTLKTFKKADYIVKITEPGQGKTLATNYAWTEVTDGKYTEISSDKCDGKEKLLYVKNNGLEDVKFTVAVTTSEAQPLTTEPYTLGKNESKKISFVATQDGRYLITKDNENVQMTDGKYFAIDGDGNEDKTRPSAVKDAYPYVEQIMHKGDKIIYTLSYKPDTDDKKAADTQTVKVSIAPVAPTEIGAAQTPVTVKDVENNYPVNKSFWYQFINTAQADTVYRFTLKDALGNEVDVSEDNLAFYQRMDQADPSNDVKYGDDNKAAECYIKADKKVFINLKDMPEGSYTMKYEAVATLTDTGVTTLDFDYAKEVQEVKFIAPKAGTYKITARAIRGSFDVEGHVGGEEVFSCDELGSTAVSGKTDFLKKDDIVTLKITANNSGKSSISLRIAEAVVAETLKLGEVKPGVSSTEELIYYELRVPEKGLYAVTAGGAPAIHYISDSDKNANGEVDGTAYVELEANDRINLIVDNTTNVEQAYTIKVEKVTAESLDGKNTKENKFALSECENKFYSFTTEEAYAQYTASSASDEGDYYYIAWEAIETDANVVNINANVVNERITSLKKGQIVTFTATKTSNERADEQTAGKEAFFKLTIKKLAAQNTINTGETKSGTLHVGERITYTFKTTEKAKYVVNFNGSGCEIEVKAADGKVFNNAFTTEGTEGEQTYTFTISNDSSKSGIYDLTITKLAPTPLTLNQTAEGTLEKGKTVYYEFTANEAAAEGEPDPEYLVYVNTTDDENVDVNVKKNNGHLSTISTSRVYSLAKDDKLSVEVNNASDKKASYQLTVKKVDYSTKAAAGETAAALKAHETAYYTFEAGEDATYNVSVKTANAYGENLVRIAKVQAKRFGTGDDASTLGKPAIVYDYSITKGEVELKKGEQLLLDIRNNEGKEIPFTLTIEKPEQEETITPVDITLGQKYSGLLTDNKTAVYNYTASDAAEDGTVYTVYCEGPRFSYKLERLKRETNADGTTTAGTEYETVETNESLSNGSTELTLYRGDKLSVTVSKKSGKEINEKYTLLLKKVAYTALTSGVMVSKTLKANETAYYQFACTETAETKYQVYGTSSNYKDCEVSKVTVTTANGETETKVENVGYTSGYNLKNGQTLRFAVRNSGSTAKEFKLAVKKVEYVPLALGVPVEGRLGKDGECVYYEFTAGEPAADKTETAYQVYGTAQYTAYRVTTSTNADGSTTTNEQWAGNYGGDYTYSLAKGEKLRIRVYGQSSLEGYSLAVALKGEEKPITLGTEMKTGALAPKQQVVYAFTNTADETKYYTVSYDGTNEDVTVAVTLDTVTLDPEDLQRIRLAKDQKLTVTIKAAGKPVSDFAFTVSEFRAEAIPSGAAQLKAGESKYYEYTVPEDGNYVIAMTGTNSNITLFYEVTKGTAKSGTIRTIDEIEFNKDDVVLLKVTAPGTKAAAQYAFRLTMQKVPAEPAALGIRTNTGTLQAGAVQYLAFKVPEAEKGRMSYLVSTGADAARSKLLYSGIPTGDWSEKTEDFTVRIFNTSMSSAADYTIEVQKMEPIAFGEYTGELNPGEKKYFVFPGNAVTETTKDDAGNDTTVTTYKPYYITIPNTNNCLIYNAEPGMNYRSDVHVVTVSNSGSQTAQYAFALKNEMRSEIKAATARSETLVAYEAAYYKVTAPAEKALNVSVSSTEETDTYYSKDMSELIASDGYWLETGDIYGIPAGETYFFKVANADDKSVSYTFRVSDTYKTALKLEEETKTVYIPNGASVDYTFTAPDDGSYSVYVKGGIQSSASCTYAVGSSESAVYANGSPIELKKNDTVKISVKNTASIGSASCTVLVLGGETEKTIKPGSNTVIMTSRTDSYTFDAEESGNYVLSTDDADVTINGNTSIWMGYLGAGATISFRTTAAVPHVVTVNCFKRSKTTTVSDESSTDITLAKDEAALITLSASTEYQYTFAFNSNANVEYWYSKSGSMSDILKHETGRDDSFEIGGTGGSTGYGYLLVRAKADNTKITVAGTKVPPQEVELGSNWVYVESGVREQITFTAPEQNRYRFRIDGADAEFDNGCTVQEGWLYEGGSVTFDVSYTGSGYGTGVSIYVEKITPQAEIGVGTETYKIPARSYGWFQFTAGEAAVYTFAVKHHDGGSSESFSLYHDIGDSGSIGSESQWLEAGEAIYVSVRNDYSDQAGTEFDITVTRKEPLYNEVLTIDAHTSWEVSFTAQETGTYTYVGYTDDGGDFTITCEDDAFDVFSENTEENPAERKGRKLFMEGETGTLIVTNNTDESHMIGVRVEQNKAAVEVEDGKEHSYPLKPGDNYFAHTVQQDGEQLIAVGYHSGLTLQYCINNADEWVPLDNDAQIVGALKRGDKLVLKVTTSDSYTSTLQLAMGAVSAIGIQDETGYELSPYETAYHVFTAEKAGLYRMTPVTLDGFLDYYYTDEEKSSQYVSSDSGRLFDLAEGSTVIWRVRNSEDSIGRYMFTVTEDAEVVELSLGTPCSLKTIAAGEDAFFRYQAQQDGCYEIAVEGNAGDYVYYTVDNGLQGSFSCDETGSEAFRLEAGSKLLMRIRNGSSDSDKEVTLTLTYAASEAVETGDTHKTIPAYTAKYYQFTPDEAGKYAIALSDNVIGYYVNEYDAGFSNAFDGRVFDLQQDGTLWFKVLNGSDTDVTFTISIAEKQDNQLIEISTEEGENGIEYSLLANEEQLFRYTAGDAGLYTIKNTEDVRLGYGNTESIVNMAPRSEVTLILGDKEILYLKLYPYNKTTGTLRAEKETGENLASMELEAAEKLQFETYGQTQWRKIAIPEAGKYTVSGEFTGIDCYVECISSESTKWMNMYGSHKDLSVDLPAGDVYIKVYPYDNYHITYPDYEYVHDISITVTKNN